MLDREKIRKTVLETEEKKVSERDPKVDLGVESVGDQRYMCHDFFRMKIRES